jgi:hypothetical protein
VDCTDQGMATTDRLVRWGGRRLSKRMSRSVPWLGTAIALATVATTMKKKGLFRGAMDTGLNAVPFLGAAKNVVEIVRGRDFFPDRPPVARPIVPRATAPQSGADRPIPPARRPKFPA